MMETVPTQPALVLQTRPKGLFFDRLESLWQSRSILLPSQDVVKSTALANSTYYLLIQTYHLISYGK